MLGPVTIAFISILFPIETRGRAFSVFAAVQLLSNLIGPLAGGWIAVTMGWSAAFFMVLPFGILSLATILFTENNRDNTKATPSLKRVDFLGASLLGMAIALFVQTWTLFEQTGWGVQTAMMITGSILALVGFIFQQNRHPDPILPQRLVSIRNVMFANVSAACWNLNVWDDCHISVICSDGIKRPGK